MILTSLLQVAVGRVVLAWLPPGWPGYADRGELGATLTASWLLGILSLSVLPAWWIWAIVLGLRLATLPGALRPRHVAPKGWGALHGTLFIVLFGLRFLDSKAALIPIFALPVAWMATAYPVWVFTADRRARALGIVAIIALTLFMFGAMTMGSLYLQELS